MARAPAFQAGDAGSTPVTLLMRFTGFFEATGQDIDEVAMTFGYVETDDLLERLRARLEAVPPGTHVRVDLIAWSADAAG